MNTYWVSLNVIYTTIVEAENETEAIEKAECEIELDVDPSCEPFVAKY